MKQWIREHLKDCSDEQQFCFSLTCTECGTEWKSDPVRFSKAREKPPPEEKEAILRVLYQREYVKAREKALDDALYNFNLCPLCGRLVCNHCFAICDDLDMCRACSCNYQEQGEVVESMR